MTTSTDPGLPVPPTRTQPRQRRNTLLLLLGVLAICLGALGAATLYTRSTHTTQVVRVAKAVERGQVIGPTDLSIVSLPDTPGLATVPASQLQSLVGQPAATDLVPGTLLVPTDVGTPEIASGTVVVGLRLDDGRLPGKGLGSGTSVLLVAVPGTGQPVDKADASFRGVLLGAPRQADNGGWLVDVAVAQGDAQRIARLGAVGQIALIRQADR